MHWSLAGKRAVELESSLVLLPSLV